MGADVNFDGSLGFTAGVRLNELERDLARLRQEVKSTVNKVESDGQRMEKMFSGAAKAAGAFFSLQQGSQLVSAITQVRAEFQKYEAVLTNTLGSQKDAADAMDLIKNIAASTPFGVGELTNSYIKLVNQGFKPTRDMIISLGDLAASQGKSLDQLTEAIIDAQTGEFERLKEFGVRASKEGDKVTFTFKEQATTVDFAASSIRDYILSLGQMQGVAGGMEAISKTIGGQLSNLEDAIESMFNKIGQANEGVISDAISSAAWLVDHYEEVGKALLVLVTTYGAYRTAVILATAATNGWTIAQTLGYRWLLLVERAQRLLNATMLANPYVLAATALTAVVGALVLFGGEADQATKAQERLNQALEDQQQNLAATKGRINELVQAISNENLSNDTRSAKLRELKTLSDGRLNQLTLEAFKTGEATKAIREYVAALDAEAKMKAYQSVKQDNYKRLAEIEDEDRKRAEQFAKDNFDKPWYKQLFNFKGFSTQQTLANSAGNREEKNALEQQNKDIDESIKQSLEAQDKRSAGQRAVEVKNKEYYETLKKDAQARLDALSEIQAKGQEGRKIIAEIQGYDKVLDSYSVSSANKAANAASKDALADQKRNLAEEKQLQEQREQLQKQTNDKLESLRIDRLEGIERDKAVNQREYDQMVEDYKKLGIYNGTTKNILDNWLTGANANSQAKYDQKAHEDRLQWIDKSIQEYGNYQQKIFEINKKFDAEIKKANEAGRNELIGGINDARQTELQELDNQQAQIIGRSEQFFDNLLLNSKELVKTQIATIEELLKSSTIDPQARKKLLNDLNNMKKLLNVKNEDLEIAQIDQQLASVEQRIKAIESGAPAAVDELGKLYDQKAQLGLQRTDANLKKINDRIAAMDQLGQSVSQLGSSLSNLGKEAGTLSQIGGAMQGLGDNMSQLTKLFEGFKSGAFKSGGSGRDSGIGGYAQAAQAAVQMIEGIISASQQRKEKLKEFYMDMIGMQNDYNLSLIEETRLRAEMGENVFIKDYAGRMKSGLEAAIKSNETYRESLEDLQKASVKIGTVKKNDWKKIISNTVTGAAAGAVVGGPWGAAIGAVAGFVTGLFSKKRVDVFDGLLKTYPDLISAEGKLNEERAKALLSGNLLNAESKQLLQNTVNLNAEYKKSQEQIRGIVGELAGSLGDDLRNSLVDAFKNGTDAAVAFGDSVEKVLENIVAQMLFSELFNDAFSDLQKRMEASFGLNGDNKFTDDIIEFYKIYGDRAQLFNEALKQAQIEAKNAGLDIFQPTNGKSTNGANRNTLSGNFQSMSQDTGNLLAGQFMGQRVATIELVSINKRLENIAFQNLDFASQTATNTYDTVRRLDSMLDVMKWIQRNHVSSADMALAIGGIGHNANRAIGL